MKDLPILCPCCLSPLVVTHRDRYEDLSDRVSNPNETPSMKDGYQCLNHDWCFASTYNCTWLEDGDFFCGAPPEGMGYGDISRILDRHWKFPTKTLAVNSWNFFYRLGEIERKKRIKSFTIGKYTVRFIPRDKGYKYPLSEQYMPRKFSYKTEILKATSDGCYTVMISDYRMIKHTISDFNANYYDEFNTNGASYRGTFLVDKCMEAIRCSTISGYEDRRRYKVISMFLIKILFPYKVKRIKNLAKEKKRFF